MQTGFSLTLIVLVFYTIQLIIARRNYILNFMYYIGLHYINVLMNPPNRFSQTQKEEIITDIAELGFQHQAFLFKILEHHPLVVDL